MEHTRGTRVQGAAWARTINVGAAQGGAVITMAAAVAIALPPRRDDSAGLVAGAVKV